MPLPCLFPPTVMPGESKGNQTLRGRSHGPHVSAPLDIFSLALVGSSYGGG